MAPPVISVVTATYNRSNVLRYSIESVLRSTFTDWELLVIGDGCTDDSEDVVGSFGDPRIRFVNLPANFGEQSGPNNEAFKLSRGKYIAYLNHDDLYFPDHLETSLDYLKETGADLVFAAMAAAWPRTPEELARNNLRFRLFCASPTGRYEPYVYAPASAWLLRRELIESIGPWRAATECVLESSQEFLFRAWRAGKELRFKPQMTVLAVQSGLRQDVYLKREFYENEHYGGQLKNNFRFREEVLSHIAINLAGHQAPPKIHFSLARAFRKLIYRPALRLGLHPKEALELLKGRKKGSQMSRLRRSRGLEHSSTISD